MNYHFWEDSGDGAGLENISSNDLTSCDLVANDNWVLSADTADTTISGVPWQARGAMNTAFASAMSDMAQFDSLDSTLCRDIETLVVAPRVGASRDFS